MEAKYGPYSNIYGWWYEGIPMEVPIVLAMAVLIGLIRVLFNATIYKVLANRAEGIRTH